MKVAIEASKSRHPRHPFLSILTIVDDLHRSLHSASSTALLSLSTLQAILYCASEKAAVVADGMYKINLRSQAHSLH